MELIEKIINHNMFLPILAITMIVLILIFIIILVSGKKREKKELAEKQIKREEYIKNIEPATFEEEKIVEEKKEEISAEQKLEQKNYVIDLPIPEMNDEEVGAPIIEETEHNIGEEVVIPTGTQLVEENIPESEHIKLNVSNSLNNLYETGEEVEAPEKQFQDNTPGEEAYNLEREDSRIRYPESGETASLSNIETIGNRVALELNTNSSDLPDSYFKTEVLDISEISGDKNEI